MGETVDPSDAALAAHIRLVKVPPASPDTGSEAVPDVPAAPSVSPGLAERFEAVAPGVLRKTPDDAGVRPAPSPVPAQTPPATAVRGGLFDVRIQQVIGKEGHYSNDPADRGGATTWGITEATARAFGYHGDMRAMPRDMAIEIYRRRYWIAPSFDLIEAIDPPIALKLLDLGITSGPATGVKFLQRALNALNKEGQTYPDVAVDGGAGVITRAALKAFVGARGRDGRLVLLGMIAAQQSVYYLQIAETRPANERFEYGWQLNRALAGIA